MTASITNTENKIIPRSMIYWLTLAHFTNDFFTGSLGVILAAQKNPLDLSNTQVGIATTIFIGISGLIQPFLGGLADRSGRPYLLIWGALVCGMGALAVGLAGSFGILLLGAFVMSIGNGMFHPAGLGGARAFARTGSDGRSIALFMLGGNGGFALSPLIVGFLLDEIGLVGIAPPVAVALVFVPIMVMRLYPYLNGDLLGAKKQTGNEEAESTARVTQQQTSLILPWYRAARVVIFAYLFAAFFRGMLQAVLAAYLPLFFVEQGRDLAASGAATSSLFVFAAIGSFVGASLSDYIPRLRILAFTMLTTTPLLLLVLQADGWWLFVLSIVTGLMLNGGLPIMLMIGQEVLPGGGSAASGMAFGWMFISQSAGNFATGLLADVIGLEAALQVLAFSPLLGLPLIFLLPRGETIKQQQARQPETSPA